MRRAPLLKQRVGADRGAVQHLGQRGRLQARGVEHEVEAGQHRRLGRRGGGGDLGCEDRAVVEHQHEVGEGAADVDAEARRAAHVWSETSTPPVAQSSLGHVIEDDPDHLGRAVEDAGGLAGRRRLAELALLRRAASAGQVHVDDGHSLLPFVSFARSSGARSGPSAVAPRPRPGEQPHLGLVVGARQPLRRAASPPATASISAPCSVDRARGSRWGRSPPAPCGSGPAA